MTALLAARHALLDDRVEGATVYFSDQTHSSVERALRVIGFSPNNYGSFRPVEDFNYRRHQSRKPLRLTVRGKAAVLRHRERRHDQYGRSRPLE